MTQVLKILIADDDAELRAALAEQLSLHEEFSAVHADSAEGALSASRRETPDLIIMDVGLPDMDGREAVKLHARGRLQKSDHHADRPGQRVGYGAGPRRRRQ